MSVEKDRPIGPDQPVVTPVAEPYDIHQTMNAPIFELLLKQTTEVQVQLADRVRGIEEFLMSMPTRADIMVQERPKTAAREGVERQRRLPVGTEKIPRTESQNSPYGHQERDTAESGPSGR